MAAVSNLVNNLCEIVFAITVAFPIGSQSFIVAAACYPASSSTLPSTRLAPLQMTVNPYHGNAPAPSRRSDCHYGRLYADPDTDAPESSAGKKELTWIQGERYANQSEFFVNGDIKGAIAYAHTKDNGNIRMMEVNGMNNKASITALMSSFGRAFHAENEDHPVFADHLAKRADDGRKNILLFKAISSVERSSLNQRSTLLNRHRRSCCASS